MHLPTITSYRRRHWGATGAAASARRARSAAPSTRYRRPVVAGLLSGGLIAVVGAASVATAAPRSGASASERVIRLRTTLVSSTVNGAGHGGPGDVSANVLTLRTSAGRTGHAFVSCQVMTASENLCHASFVLPGGQIDAQAAIMQPGTDFVAAITGGTGEFDAVSGYVRNVQVAPGVQDRVFHLTADRH